MVATFPTRPPHPHPESLPQRARWHFRLAMGVGKPKLWVVRKGQWGSKIGVGIAIGLGIERTRDGIRT